MAYTYVLMSLKNNSYYVGSTTDMKQRYEKHLKGQVKSTKSRLPVKLVFLKQFATNGEARSFELKIKSWKSRSSIESMFDKPDNIAAHCRIV